MSERRIQSPVSIGVVSLVCAFSVLIMAAFAVLCLASAHADNVLAKRTGDSIAAYYAADAQAEEKYAHIASLAANYRGAVLETQLRSAGFAVAPSTEVPGALRVSFETEINAKRVLRAEVSVQFSGGKASMERLCWKTETKLQE